MGDRGQVLIEDTGVYLYTHWSAYNLPETVINALRKHWRWTDPEYLARIIFDEMTEGSHGEENSFGISTDLHGDVWRLITINCSKQTIKLEDMNYPNGFKTIWEKTFQQAIEDSL